MADLFSNPNDLALASLGLRLMSTPGKLGPALGTSGLGALQDLQWAQQVAKQRQMQELVLKERQEELRRKRAEEDAAKLKETQLDAAYRGAFVSPAEQALSGGGGPTVGNAAAMQGLRPQISQDRLIEGLMKIDPRLAFQMAQPKTDDVVNVAPGGTLYSTRDRKPLFTAAPAAESQPGAIKEYQFAVSQGYKGTYEQWRQAGKPAGTTVNVNTGERIPPQLIKQQDELIDKVSTARSIDADLGAVEKQIASGALQFGPVRNLINTGRNVAGVSNEESRAFGTFKSTLEKLRNDSLRLNTGVQTEGDAQRAWNELFQNINDTAFVQQRLSEIRKLNQRAAQIHEYRLNTLRQNSGAGPLQQPSIVPAIGAGTSQGGAVPAASKPTTSNW